MSGHSSRCWSCKVLELHPEQRPKCPPGITCLTTSYLAGIQEAGSLSCSRCLAEPFLPLGFATTLTLTVPRCSSSRCILCAAFHLGQGWEAGILPALTSTLFTMDLWSGSGLLVWLWHCSPPAKRLAVLNPRFNYEGKKQNCKQSLHKSREISKERLQLSPKHPYPHLPAWSCTLEKLSRFDLSKLIHRMNTSSTSSLLQWVLRYRIWGGIHRLRHCKMKPPALASTLSCACTAWPPAPSVLFTSRCS